jgi:hypothetical protein
MSSNLEDGYFLDEHKKVEKVHAKSAYNEQEFIDLALQPSLSPHLDDGTLDNGKSAAFQPAIALASSKLVVT